MIVSHPLQEARFLAARRRLYPGSQLAQIRFINVQGEICRRAQCELGTPLGVLCMADPEMFGLKTQKKGQKRPQLDQGGKGCGRRRRHRTCDPGSERAPGYVILVVLDDDAVISRQGGQVADATRPVLVVHTVDLGFGRALNSQVQTPFLQKQNKLRTRAFSTQGEAKRQCVESRVELSQLAIA